MDLLFWHTADPKFAIPDSAEPYFEDLYIFGTIQRSVTTTRLGVPFSIQILPFQLKAFTFSRYYRPKFAVPDPVVLAL